MPHPLRNRACAGYIQEPRDHATVYEVADQFRLQRDSHRRGTVPIGQTRSTSHGFDHDQPRWDL